MSKYKAILNEMRNILGMEALKLEETTETVETEIVETVETEVKLAEATLEDGTIIYFDGELVIETAVFKDEALTIALEDGEYITEGTKFVIVEGIITEIEIPEVVETPEDAPVVEEEMAEDFEKKYNDLKVVVEEMKSKLANFEANEIKLMGEITKLSAEPEVQTITQEPQDKRELTPIEKRMNTLEAIRKMSKK